MSLPFTFHWSNETDTAFDPSTMATYDVNILSFELSHDEGQVPSLQITIKNPRVGLLSPGRKTWAWLAWWNGNAYVPLFFGVLVGIPTDLFKESITLQLIARSPNFIENKQALAESLKVAPNYDPIWIDDRHRDDPDTILEGYSSLWHIDRTSLAITASDILVGEDGTITYDGTNAKALYDSVSMTLGQAPLVNLRVEATVNWTQRSAGFFNVPTVNLSTYTGDTFMSDWPKAGASIGGGYTVESSFVNDIYHVAQTPTMSYNSSWTNNDPNPGQCSNESATTSSSGPALLSPNALTCVLTGEFTSGVCFPDSDPPMNIPASTSVTGMIVPMWSLSASMTIRYEANRSFSELLSFDMICNTQSILASPLVDQNTELLTIASVDIGKPLIEVEAWSDFKGSAVGLAQVVFPNNPTKPGGLSYQICVVPGTAGETEPDFSDIVGTTTTDGTVTWASMGGETLTDAPNWSPATFVPLGQIMLLTNQTFNAAAGNFEDIPNATTYYLCTRAGQTNSTYDTFTYTPPVEDNDEGTPAERTISVINPPTFSTSVGAQIGDGSVVWTVLGQAPALLGIPLGGTAGNVTARCFFPTARGQQSIEYLIAKARARLRLRARAVNFEWDCPFKDAVALSCRKNATLFDERIPGGAATGKVIGYKLTCDGEGQYKGHVKIGCSVGFGNSIAAIDGTPEYAADGYVAKGYQVYDGSTVLTDASDIGYTPPAFVPFDDGLAFPLTWADVSDGGRFSGSLAAQKAAIEASFTTARILAFSQMWAGKSISSGDTNTTTTGLTSAMAWTLEEQELALASQNTPYVMQANPISWTALLKPCNGGGPFVGSYAVELTMLEVPQGINLEATSS